MNTPVLYRHGYRSARRASRAERVTWLVLAGVFSALGVGLCALGWVLALTAPVR